MSTFDVACVRKLALHLFLELRHDSTTTFLELNDVACVCDSQPTQCLVLHSSLKSLAFKRCRTFELNAS